MRQLKSAFSLEVFDRKNARSPHLSEYLHVYLKNYPPEHRTKTNELVEFLENQTAERKIFYFGLRRQGRPCGFSTFMYYCHESIGIIDHFVISENSRGYGAFYAFGDLVADFIEESKLPIDHIAVEIMLGANQITGRVPSLLLIRLMRIVGFKVARQSYWAPDPAIVKDADACKAALMLFSQPEREDLPAFEFMQLVELIYRGHYADWYRKTMGDDEFTTYSKACEETLSAIRKDVLKHKRIQLNGAKGIDLHFSLNSHPPVDFSAVGYVAFISVPAVITVAVALTQEMWVTLSSAGILLCTILLTTLNPILRQILLKFFRLTK